MFRLSSSIRAGQNIVEVSIALTLIVLVAIGGLTLFSGKFNGLYSAIACQLVAASQTNPNPCGPNGVGPNGLPLPPGAYIPKGPSTTFINPNIVVVQSGPLNNFVMGNQCHPDCPFGAKFIGVPNFVAGPGPAGVPSYTTPPSYDSYAYGIFSIVDKNQCTYGAVAEWLTIHQANPSWGPSYILSYPSIQDNAGSMYARAVAAGYTVSPTPLSGAMVVYKNGWAGSPNGHIATVVGVSQDRTHYTVIEQNLLYVELNDESGVGFPPYRWNIGGFDIRTAAFPDPEIAGFIYGPPGTILPTDQATITGYVGPPTPTPSPT